MQNTSIEDIEKSVIHQILKIKFLYIFMIITEYIIVAIIGACLGSFSTFIGHRIFSEKLSLAGGRSVCAKCNNTLPIKALIPIFSYIFCRGKCLLCNQKISIRYPSIEVIMSFCAVYSYYLSGFSLKTFALIILCVCICIQIATDVEYYMASDFTDLIMLFAVLYLSYIDGKDWKHNLSFAIYGIVFMLLCRKFVMWRTGEDALGFGDIKIVGVMAPLANSDINLVFTIGIFGVVGIFFGIAWRKYCKTQIFPFAPPIMFAFLINYMFLSKYFA